VGQTVWLTVSGPNGVPTLKLLEGYPITEVDVANGIGRDIPREELEKYSDGDEMTVVCKVGLDGTEIEVEAISFPKLHLTMTTKAPPILSENFENAPLQHIVSTNPRPIDLPSMTITVEHSGSPSNPATYGIYEFNDPAGGPQSRILMFQSGGIDVMKLTIQLKSAYSKVSFMHLNFMNASYYVYNMDGVLLDSQTITSPNKPPMKTELSFPGIWRIVFQLGYGSGHTVLDEFVFTI
jgi:hypothetical protein